MILEAKIDTTKNTIECKRDGIVVDASNLSMNKYTYANGKKCLTASYSKMNDDGTYATVGYCYEDPEQEDMADAKLIEANVKGSPLGDSIAAQTKKFIDFTKTIIGIRTNKKS